MILPLFVREYIVIAGLIIIGSYVFYFCFRDKIFIKWGRLLFLTLSAAYLSRNFFLSIFILFGLIQIFVPKKPKIDRLSFCLLLLPLIPMVFSRNIPFPGLEKLFQLSYPRILSLFILLPLFFGSLKDSKKTIFSQSLDKYIILYFLYQFIMGFRDTTLTDAFRKGFICFLDFFILYFVISRTLASIEDFKKIFKAMAFTAFILALMAIFETSKSWHMYEALLESSHSLVDIRMIYGRRLGVLRATGSFLSPIPFGAYFVIMLGFLIYLKYHALTGKKIYFNLIAGTFFTAILCTFSRGPLLGTAILFFFIIVLERQKALKSTSILLPIVIILFFSPLSDITISMLPFIGKKQQKTIEYRKILWAHSLKVAKRSPLTGSNTYMDEPEIQELKEYGGSLRGGGVDIVNSYLQILLHYGIFGMIFFGLILLTALTNLWKAFFHIHNDEALILCKVLFSITITMIMMLATVSLISFLGHYLWILLGLCAGCIRISVNKNSCSLTKT